MILSETKHSGKTKAELNIHEVYMQRCLQIAQNAEGRAAPNPMVGSVIVHNGKIIGEGYHRQCGQPHAEVNAIASVKDPSLLPESTIYVNLEPCSHHGRTPPCSDLIIEKKIPRVVIGCVDTFSKVSGRGIKKLRDAGCEVITGVLEEESRYLNRRFFTFHEKKRPYIVLKWAQTMDGFIDIKRSADTPIQPYWITNSEARTLVHKWRTMESGILSGTNTVINDNPKLNVRDWSGNEPVRIVLDRQLRIPSDRNVFDESQQTLVFCEKEKPSTANTTYIPIDFGEKFFDELFAELYNRQILSVIIEGGAGVLNSFIQHKYWDEARIFVGDVYFFEGVKAPRLCGKVRSKQHIGNSVLSIVEPR